MRSGLEIRHGSEIQPQIVQKILRILKEHMECTAFDEIETITDLAMILEIRDEYLTLVMGQDWFLLYGDTPSEIRLKLLYADKDQKDYFKRALEIRSTLKNVLLENKDKKFKGCLRHQTSFRLYQKMLEKGYIEGIITRSLVTYKKSFKYNIINFVTNMAGANAELLKYTSFYEDIYHNVEFFVTPKFVETYDLTRNNTRTRKK